MASKESKRRARRKAEQCATHIQYIERERVRLQKKALAKDAQLVKQRLAEAEEKRKNAYHKQKEEQLVRARESFQMYKRIVDEYNLNHCGSFTIVPQLDTSSCDKYPSDGVSGDADKVIILDDDDVKSEPSRVAKNVTALDDKPGNAAPMELTSSADITSNNCVFGITSAQIDIVVNTVSNEYPGVASEINNGTTLHDKSGNAAPMEVTSTGDAPSSNRGFGITSAQTDIVWTVSNESPGGALYICPLSPDEQKAVNSAMNLRGSKHKVIKANDTDSVQRHSMQTLRPGQWLNDEIINYFLKNCLAVRDKKICSEQSGRKRSHFFNTFFIFTMFDEENIDQRLRGKYNYQNVKRWGAKVPGKDIFNLKYIFCPINIGNLHWTSAVIFMEEKRIQYYDSMGGTDRAKLEGLLQYLKDEYKAKKGEELDISQWTLVNNTKDTPKQENGDYENTVVLFVLSLSLLQESSFLFFSYKQQPGFDCGVFTCMFADFISRDLPLTFDQGHLIHCRDRIALSIMKS